MISKCSRYCFRSPSDNWGSLNSSLVKLRFRADLALVNDQTACDTSQVCEPWIMVDWEMTCVSRWAFTHSSHPHPICTDIRFDIPNYTEGDRYIGPFLIIFHWLIQQALSQLGPTAVLDGACTWPFHPSKSGLIPDCPHRRLKSGSI